MHEIIDILKELLDSVKALNNKVDILLARNPGYPGDGISEEDEEEYW
jgi:hypothetical protein